jgi:hypothetical protein
MQASNRWKVVPIILSPVNRCGNRSRDVVYASTVVSRLHLRRTTLGTNSIGPLDPLRILLEYTALKLALLHKMEAACARGSSTWSFRLGNGRGLELLWILARVFHDRSGHAGRVEIKLGYLVKPGIWG